MSYSHLVWRVVQVLKTRKNIELGELHCFPSSKSLRKSLETASDPIGGGMMVSALQMGINFVRYQKGSQRKWPKWVRGVFFFTSLDGTLRAVHWVGMGMSLQWGCLCPHHHPKEPSSSLGCVFSSSLLSGCLQSSGSVRNLEMFSTVLMGSRGC